MIKVGITGGIGSGKSVVSEIFRLHNIPVFDADTEAKNLNDSSPVIKSQLIHHFGNDIYENDRLNRKRFADLIFSNERNLEIANSIIHPEVANCFIQWCNNLKNNHIVAIEAALLIEAGFNKIVDKVITVYAPEELRIERVMKRDHTDKDKVEARIHNQLPENERIKFSDFVIYNDNRQSLVSQVSKVIDRLTITETQD